MEQPQIHVLLDEPEVPPYVAAALRRMDAGVRLSRLERELSRPTADRADARLVVASPNTSMADRHWRQLLRQYSQQTDACATLVLTPMPVRSDEVEEAGGIGYATDLSADELAGRLSAMCEFRRSFEWFRRQIAHDDDRSHRQEHPNGSADHYDEQMRLASQLQRDLLPNPIPQIAGAKLHTLYRPADHVSGDIYDVARLDEEHVALSIADATGHGLPAALLTMLIKSTLRGKQVDNGTYRLVPPAELMTELNRELLDANLTRCQFVAGLYAVYHEPMRTLVWARGGAPEPILIRPGQRPRALDSAGPLLGVLTDAGFQTVETVLEPGDTVLLRTDGLDAIALVHEGRRVHDDISQTDFFSRLGRVPLSDLLAQLAEQLDTTPSSAWPVDDVTVLALEIQ